MDALETAGVPAGPVLDIGQMSEDPQTRAREMIMEVQHSRGRAGAHAGTADQILRHPRQRAPGGTPSGRARSAEILRESGYDEDAIAAMAATGAVILDQDPG